MAFAQLFDVMCSYIGCLALQEITNRELDILNTLVNGTAIEEHMETFYLQTLKQCVMAVNPELEA